MGVRSADVMAVAMMGFVGVVLGSAPGMANDPEDAHQLAERFANAHNPTPTPDKIKTETVQPSLQADHVEGAFRTRKEEAELQSRDQLLDAIEARTKAIEDLLEKSAVPSWRAVAVPAKDNGAKDKKDVLPSHASQPAVAQPAVTLPAKAVTDVPSQPDIYELPEPSYALGRSPSLRSGLAEASKLFSKATVLLKLKPGNTGLRRFKKTADPVLCGRRHCYVSQGYVKAAQRAHRGATLGPFNTLGRRAGACRQNLSCAFRGIDVSEDGVLLQPIDLKIMRHDRRAYRSLKADPTCRVAAGRLHCSNAMRAKTWTAWVVPEHIALEAGEDGLKTALQDGLPENPMPTFHVGRTN